MLDGLRPIFIRLIFWAELTVSSFVHKYRIVFSSHILTHHRNLHGTLSYTNHYKILRYISLVV